MRRNAVLWPAVQTFPSVRGDKAQMVKVLEEAAEVYAAWQELDRGATDDPKELVDEAADLVQALSNLLSAYNCEDMRQAMFECHERNVARGRFQ